MSARMKAGLGALWFLTGFSVLLALLNLAGLFRNTRFGALSSFLVMIGAIPLLAFLFVCLWGISRGYRTTAVLALIAPVFLSLPLVTEIIAFGTLDSIRVLLEYSHDEDSWFLWFLILFRLLMLAVLVAAWPLAFGATNPFPRVFSLFAGGFKACLEKCLGKWRARWKRRQARIHAEEARALFEAVAALRQRAGMPIASVIASYDDIVQRYGQDEAPAVRDWVEKALKEKNAILCAQEQSATTHS
ncbi:MAG: hypothetical protein LBU11_06515 [Zoogloeaceae bacterium]|nr:hypothetical protein [Zoogloeaceae bacterium]